MKNEKSQLFSFPCGVCTNMVCAESDGTRPSEVRVLILKLR